MKITLFTSNNVRHNYLINLFSRICDELFVVQEYDEIITSALSEKNSMPKIKKKYLKKVNDAQNLFFNNSQTNHSLKNIKVLKLLQGDLSKNSFLTLADFLKSDLYVVYGSSYIKGDLIDFLIEKKAINIHMGVSPYYRGTDCNFWALYDNNPHLVGATIHLLSKGLDSGSILYHAMSNLKLDPLEYTMSTVKSAFHSITDKIKDKSIFKIKPTAQEKSKEIRYSKNIEFTEDILIQYSKMNIDLNSKKFEKLLLKNPYFLKI